MATIHWKCLASKEVIRSWRRGKTEFQDHGATHLLAVKAIDMLAHDDAKEDGTVLLCDIVTLPGMPAQVLHVVRRRMNPHTRRHRYAAFTLDRQGVEIEVDMSRDDSGSLELVIYEFEALDEIAVLKLITEWAGRSLEG